MSDSPNPEQHLVDTLESNLQEILDSINQLHGKEHANLTTLFFCLQQNIRELESTACKYTSKLENNSEHTASHLQAGTSLQMIKQLIDSISETVDGHKTLTTDVQTLITRADVDYHSKRKQV